MYIQWIATIYHKSKIVRDNKLGTFLKQNIFANNLLALLLVLNRKVCQKSNSGNATYLNEKLILN